MRLDKYITSTKNLTRKEVKKIIKDKSVKINDKVANSPSLIIDEYKDVIKLNDEVLIYHLFHYFILNKPQGYVSSTKMEKNYLPVTSLFGEYEYCNLFPVGRLDVDSTGLILMTNDGKLAHQLLSPKYHVDKVYEVSVDFPLKQELIKPFQEGIVLDGEMTLTAKLEIVDEFHAKVILHEGKFHQVKRMFSYFGYKVITLHRAKFAFLTLDGVKEGSFRELTVEEINRLKELVNS